MLGPGKDPDLDQELDNYKFDMTDIVHLYKARHGYCSILKESETINLNFYF